MPLYMYQASYTSESAANLLEEPQDRIKAVAKAFEGIKAEILVGGYPLGKYDVLVVYTAPDDATAGPGERSGLGICYEVSGRGFPGGGEAATSH